MSQELRIITSTSFKTEQLLMVNIYLFLYQFFINGAGRCPTQPLNNLHFFFLYRPFKQLGLFYCLLFVFVLFLFSATISNLTLGSRIVSSTVYPTPNGTLKENVTVVFSSNIVSFCFINNLDLNLFRPRDRPLPPLKNWISSERFMLLLQT